MMKKRMFYLILTMVILMLVGCSQSEKKEVTSNNEKTIEKDMNETEKKDKNDVSSASKDLSDKWFDNQVQINGKVLTIPISISELNKLGFKLNYSKEYMLNPGDSVAGTHLTNDKGNTISGTYSNLSDKAIDIKESSLTSINITNTTTTNKDFDIIFPGGIKFGDSIEQIKEVYGEPKDTYEGNSGFNILTYQKDIKHYAKLTFSNGKLSGYELYI